MSFGFSLWKMNSIVSVPAYFFQTWDRRPSLLYVELVHIGASILTGFLYHSTFPLVSQLIWFTVISTVIVSFMMSVQAK